MKQLFNDGKQVLLATIFLLALLLVALGAVYSLRLPVTIDVGDYYDSPYLRGFHAREVDSAGAGDRTAWQPDAQSITLDGNRNGQWIVTLYAAEDQPDGVFAGLAMSANGERLTIPRQGERFIMGIISPDIAAANRLTIQLEPGLREGPEPPAGLVGEAVMEPARTYRWSKGESHILLPGVGRGAWVVEMNSVIAHPNSQPVDARVVVNDRLTIPLPDNPAMRRYRMLVPASAMPHGDMDMTLQANTYIDPRPLGVFVSQVAVSPAGTANLATGLPPTGVWIASSIIVLMFSLCLAMLTRAPLAMGQDPGNDNGNSIGNVPQTRLIGGVSVPVHVLVAVLAGVMLISGGAWALTEYRFPTTFMLPALAGLAVWSFVLLLVVYPMLRWLFGDMGKGTTQAGDWQLSPSAFVGLLLLICFAGYWIKAGGMLYPYFVGIDVHWHMDRVRWILNGDLAVIYGVDSPLNDSTMPLAEWGHVKPVIPYSPYYHMFAALFVIFPWSLEMSASMVSALFDTLHVPLIALLAWHSGLRQRAVLLAALLYTVLPVKFLLHSWGNVPTSSGMAFAFAVTVCIVVLWQRLHRRLPFALLTLLLIAAFLFYTVAGVFTGFVLVVFTLLIILAAKTRQTTIAPLLMRGLRWLWGAIAVAVVLVLVIYYGQYIMPIINQTIPYFIENFTSSAESMGKAGDTLAGYIARHGRLWGYGLAVPLVLTTYWIVNETLMLWRTRVNHPSKSSPRRHRVPETGQEIPGRTAEPQNHRGLDNNGGDGDILPGGGQEQELSRVLLWAAVTGWMVLTYLFLVLAFKVSMVDKHFFISIPVMVIASAAVLDRLWQRGAALRVLIVVWYGYLAVSAVDLWIMRIVTVRQ